MSTVEKGTFLKCQNYFSRDETALLPISTKLNSSGFPYMDYLEHIKAFYTFYYQVKKRTNDVHRRNGNIFAKALR